MLKFDEIYLKNSKYFSATCGGALNTERNSEKMDYLNASEKKMSRYCNNLGVRKNIHRRPPTSTAILVAKTVKKCCHLTLNSTQISSTVRHLLMQKCI